MWPFDRKKSALEKELAEIRATPLSQLSPVPVSDVPRVIIPDGGFWDAAQQPRLSPPAVIDKYPVVIGANLTGAYLSSIYRLANSGWRFQYVDLLDELVEHDPDARCVIRARMLGVASGRYSVSAAKLTSLASDEDRDLAKRIGERFALEFENIPCLTQRIQQLAWADWYGVSGLEVIWEHPDSNTWSQSDLAFIHSRRINYTNPYTWDAYIYDQGAIGDPSELGETNNAYGLRVARYPGKFVIHTPSMSGQYPTRDGEGRYVGTIMLLKRMVVRSSAQDFERVIRPWVLGYYNRKAHDGQGAPIADMADINDLVRALGALGAGSLNSAALPNSVKVELLRAVAAMSASDFLAYANRSMAKALLGQAFTTEPGANGNLGTAEVADKNTGKVLEYSARSICDTLTRDLARPWFRLNYQALPLHFCPKIEVNTSDMPSARELMDMARVGTSIGMPIEIGDLAERTYLRVVGSDDEDTPRTRMITAKDGPNPPEADGRDGELSAPNASLRLAEVKRLKQAPNSSA